MNYVTCVCFYAGGYRWAVEAHHVKRIDSATLHTRHTDMETLLLKQPSRPTRWLTLHDAHGPWQLGIPGDSDIIQLSSAVLFPLPALLSARTHHPALCGVAMEENSLTLLLDGARMSLPSTHHSVG
ncbi:hypothetical protein P4544_18060 [Halomonas sp. LY9]